MNESFEKLKREPFLPKRHYLEKLDYKENRLIKLEQMLEDPQKTAEHKEGISWDRASIALEILIARYSAGEDVASLKPYAVRSFELFKSYDEHGGEKFKLWEPDAMQYVLWLLSLAVFFDLKKYIPKISSWISTTPDDGQDVLVSRLFAPYNVKMRGETLIHEKPYADLLRATQTYGAEQQQAVAAYLKHWYRGRKDCYWYDGHKSLGVFFFGYWAFEAGLVTLAWGIDDTPYRDMRYYPKDLVDYAKQQRDNPPPAQRPHISRRTGEQCPHAGRWGVVGTPPAGFVQEAFFRENDIFPPAINTEGKEGPVTWIVLSRDDRGPTRL